MQSLRIWFCDMPSMFCVQDFYVYKMLCAKYTVVLDAHTPQVVFFSVYGNGLQKYLRKPNVLFMIGSESHYFQNRSYADFAINHRKSRNATELCVGNYRYFDLVHEIITTNARGSGGLAPYYNTPKTLFCNFIYGNKNARCRNVFYAMLNKYKTVDSLGRHNHTRCRTSLPDWDMDTPGGLEKLHMQKHYRFSICFENSTTNTDWAMTEKVIQALMVGSIPIYWGSQAIYEYIPPEAFIDVRKFNNFDAVIDHIKRLEATPTEIEKIRSVPPFIDTAPIFEQTDENISNFIYNAVEKGVPKRTLAFRIKVGVYPLLQVYAKIAFKCITYYRKRWQ